MPNQEMPQVQLGDGAGQGSCRTLALLLALLIGAGAALLSSAAHSGGILEADVALNSMFLDAVSPESGASLSVNQCTLTIVTKYDDHCRSPADDVGLVSREVVLDLFEFEPQISVRQDSFDAGLYRLQLTARPRDQEIFSKAWGIERGAITSNAGLSSEQLRDQVSQKSDAFLVSVGAQSRTLNKACSGVVRPYSPKPNETRIAVIQENAMAVQAGLENYIGTHCGRK